MYIYSILNTHTMTNDEKHQPIVQPKPSYSERLLTHIEATKQETYSFADIKRLFKEFGTIQYEEMKKTANVFRRGKYKDRTVQDVLTFDRPYLEWLVKQSWMDNQKLLKVCIINALAT